MPLSNRAQLNFTTFAAIANAAMGTTLDPPFDPFADDMSALIAAYILEDVGVTAYKACAGAIFSHVVWSCSRAARARGGCVVDVMCAPICPAPR